MHSVNLYVGKVDAAKKHDYPHVVTDGKWVLVPITEQLLKAAKADFNDDNYRGQLEHYLLHQFGQTMARVETDYFGGAGEQNAKSWLSGVNQRHDGHSSINAALKRIGVEKNEGMDEFDTIHLGSYRSDQDVIEEWEDIHGKLVERTVARLIFRALPADIDFYKSELRAYINSSEYYTETFVNTDSEIMKYYKVTENEFVNESDGTLTITSMRKQCTKEEFDQVKETAASVVDVKFHEDTKYFFMQVSPIKCKNPSSIVMADVCLEDSRLNMHRQVSDMVLMPDSKLDFTPYRIGITGMPPKKKNIAKRTIEVYDCPKCMSEGSSLPDGSMYKCSNCGHKFNIS